MLTIGHSTRTADDFIAILRAHGVNLLVDVRTLPKSRYNPQFNIENLPTALQDAGIEYRHIRELGGLRHARVDSINTGWKNASSGIRRLHADAGFLCRLGGTDADRRGPARGRDVRRGSAMALPPFDDRGCAYRSGRKSRTHPERDQAFTARAYEVRHSRRNADYVSGREFGLIRCLGQVAFATLRLRMGLDVLGFSGVVFGISAAAGFLGSLTGLGGGVVVTPALTLLLGVDLHYAMGASLVSVIATSSGAAAAYVREGYSNVRVGMFLEIATTLGAVAGAHLVSVAPVSALAIIFG